MESRSMRRLEMSFRMRRASSIKRSAKAVMYSLLPMGGPSTACPVVEMWEMDAPSEESKSEPRPTSKVSLVRVGWHLYRA